MLEILKRLPRIIIDWIAPNLRQHLETRQPMMWVLALVSGLVVACVAIVFRELIGLFQWIWTGTHRENLAETLADLPWYAVFIGPVLGGLAVGYWWAHLFPRREPEPELPTPPIVSFGRQYQRAAMGSTSAKTARGTQADTGSIPVRSTVQNVDANVPETHTRPDRYTLNYLRLYIRNEYSEGRSIPPEGVKLEDLVDAYEKRIILKALETAGDRKPEAARLLGLSARAFRYRLEKHGL